MWIKVSVSLIQNKCNTFTIVKRLATYINTVNCCDIVNILSLVHDPLALPQVTKDISQKFTRDSETIASEFLEFRIYISIN